MTRIHPEVIRVFRKYHWPGNVRELQNALEHALNFSDGNELRAEHLPPRILDAVQAQSDKNRDSEPAEPKFDLTDAVLGAEKSRNMPHNLYTNLSRLSQGARCV